MATETDTVPATTDEAPVTPKYKTGGQKTAAGITAGTNLALTGIQALIQQRMINQKKKEMAALKKQILAPTLTDKALAEANVKADAVRRQGMADASRGTVGGSGIDQDRVDKINRAAMQQYAATLSGEVGAERDRRLAISDYTKKVSDDLSRAKADRDATLFGGVKDVVQDEDLVDLFGRSGKEGRGKDTEEVAEKRKSFGNVLKSILPKKK